MVGFIGGWGRNYRGVGRVRGTRGGQVSHRSGGEINDARLRKHSKHTDRIVQYRTLISTSIGAEHTDSVFFQRNNVGESVISAKDPSANVIVARKRPMMVRY